MRSQLLVNHAGFQETRKHTSASSAIERDGKCLSGMLSVETLCAQCLLNRNAPAIAIRETRYHLELAKGFEPPTL